MSPSMVRFCETKSSIAIASEDIVLGSAEHRIKSEDLLNFIREKNVLKGFNLTHELTLKLFASMDCHRKGFITLSEWRNLFNCKHPKIYLSI
jgi:hypothetical protein